MEVQIRDRSISSRRRDRRDPPQVLRSHPGARRTDRDAHRQDQQRREAEVEVAERGRGAHHRPREGKQHRPRIAEAHRAIGTHQHRDQVQARGDCPIVRAIAA